MEQAVDPATGEPILVGVHQRCDAHAALGDAALFEALLAENARTQNALLGALREALPEDAEVLTAWEGEGQNRRLVVTVVGASLTRPQRRLLDDVIARLPRAARIV